MLSVLAYSRCKYSPAAAQVRGSPGTGICSPPWARGWKERQESPRRPRCRHVTGISCGTVFGDGWQFYNGMNAELQFISIEGNVEADFITAKSSDFIKIVFILLFCIEGSAFRVKRPDVGKRRPFARMLSFSNPHRRSTGWEICAQPYESVIRKPAAPSAPLRSSGVFVHYCENLRIFCMFTAYVYRE